MQSFIGHFQQKSHTQRTQIKAVDGILGIIILLAYRAGGKNLFPDDVNPDVFTDGIDYQNNKGHYITLDTEQLSYLVEAVSKSLDRHMKTVSPGSLKVYLSNVRNGRRPNGGAEIIPVQTQFSNSGEIKVYSRDYDEDVANLDFLNAPEWVRLLAETNA